MEYAIKVGDSLWMTSDGRVARFDTLSGAYEYAAAHISDNFDDFEVVEY